MPLSLDGSSGITGVINIQSTGSVLTGVTTVAAGSTSAPSISPSGDSNTGVFFPSADTIAFAEGGTESARFDSSGRLLIGTASAYTDVIGGAGGYTGSLWIATADSTGTGPFISAWTSSSSLDQMGTSIVLSRSKGNVVGTHGALASGNAIGSISFNGSDGSKFVSGAVIRAEIDGGVSTNDLPGRLVFATTADGAAVPTERMRIDNAGNMMVGKTSTSFNNTSGFEATSVGQVRSVVSGDACANLNRTSSDGNLIQFWQDGALEGTISVSGSTVSYNGAHLSRWSQLINIDPHDKTQRPEILRGTVMSNLDEMCEWVDPETGEPQDNEQLNKTQISTVENDPNVAGVFQSWDDDDDTWVNDYYLAMTGDFVIRIAADTTVSRGDLLISAGDGTAKPQGDRYLKDSTIAKVTSTHITCTYEDGSYCVPCVLMAC